MELSGRSRARYFGRGGLREVRKLEPRLVCLRCAAGSRSSLDSSCVLKNFWPLLASPGFPSPATGLYPHRVACGALCSVSTSMSLWEISR